MSCAVLVVIRDIMQAYIAKHHSVSKNFGIRWQEDSFLQHLDYLDILRLRLDDICLLRIVSLMQQTCCMHLKMRQLCLDLKSTLEKLSP